jgi:streptomycin 6-kinase
MLRVPDVVINAAAAWGAGWWLRDLPRLVADLEAEWSVSVERPYPHASEAFVAEARLGDGTAAVLKLLIPRDVGDARHEITMLELAGGRGCVGLLRHDASRGGCCWSASGLPLRAGPPAGAAAGDTGGDGGNGVAAGGGFRPAHWSRQGAPARRFRHHPVGGAGSSVHRGGRRPRPGLHGTAHSRPRRRAGRAGARRRSPAERPSGPWPRHVQAHRPRRAARRGRVRPRSHDAERPRGAARRRPTARARWLAQRCGLDATAIWVWGVVERVTSGLWCTRIDLQPLGRQMLMVADRLATL